MTSIFVVGDKLTDRYIHGKRHECQDGCLKFILDATDWLQVPGGAANAARSLYHSGSFVQEFNAGEEEVKIRFMEDDRCVFRVDQRSIGQRRYQSHRRNMMNWLSEKRFDGLYISDYNKGFLTDELIAEIVKLCNERKVPVVVDPKRPPACCKGAIVKCNWDYANEHRIYSAMRRYPGITFVVTKSHLPPVICQDQETVNIWMPFDKQACVNHIGAGDCFGAWLTLGLARGMTLTDAVRQAHAAGRVYVQFAHNRPPHPEEIEKELALMQNVSSPQTQGAL